jgi:Methyltransferase domain
VEHKVNSLECCKICGSASDCFDETTVLRKYSVNYYRCQSCGFVQTESPYWLDEAYSSAITRQDTGILERNLQNRDHTTAVLNLLYPEAKDALDFGAGHGIFVRLMRDKGFDFLWHDLHATNDYARGFEYDKDHTYDLLTAFEVLEHFDDPLVELAMMMALSENVFVSTTLLPNPLPRVSDWWYYAPLSGQHISLYTLEALRLLAQRFGRNLLSRGCYHLFTKAPKSRLLFRCATSQRIARIINPMHKRASLTEPDFQLMSK